MCKRKVLSKTADNNHQGWVKSTSEGILWEILNQRQAVASQTLITQEELRCCLLESFREKSALSGCIYFQKNNVSKDKHFSPVAMHVTSLIIQGLLYFLYLLTSCLVGSGL